MSLFSQTHADQDSFMPSQVVHWAESYSAVKWASVCGVNSLTYVVLSRLASVCHYVSLAYTCHPKPSSQSHRPQLSEEKSQKNVYRHDDCVYTREKWWVWSRRPQGLHHAGLVVLPVKNNSILQFKASPTKELSIFIVLFFCCFSDEGLRIG